SWELVEEGESNSDDQADEDAMFVVQSLEQSLYPLRDVADRVGNEVETFAEKLDQWSSQMQEDDKHGAVLGLIADYRNHATGTLAVLRGRHEAQRRVQLKMEWRKRIHRYARSHDCGLRCEDKIATEHDRREKTGVKDLQQWQAEADTWELFEIMLEFTHPSQDKIAEKAAILAHLGEINRHTSAIDLWDYFVLEDDLAMERRKIVRWLEQTAETNEIDVNTIVEQLEAHAGAGKARGLWSQGWLETRERIKAEKRMRLWDSPVNSTLPRINNSDNTELLVSTLDPDACKRESRVLEKSDQWFEQAMWLACWEMLRRGSPWSDIVEWCQDRNESWRAVSLGAIHSGDQDVTCLEGPDCGSLWRRMCFAAAKSGGNSLYEGAVYGLLGGDIQSVEATCLTWDDFIYTHYHALLLSQFDTYLQSFPDRLPSALAHRFGLLDAVQLHGDPSLAGRRLVQKLRGHAPIWNEAHEPMKLIQGALIGKDFRNLLVEVGLAISKKANPDDVQVSALYPLEAQEEKAEPCSIVTDPNALRILTHMLLAFQDLGMDLGRDRNVIENIIVAYIEFLCLAGKTEMMPLYASRLSKNRAKMALGRLLPAIRSPSEQLQQVRLMKQSGIEPIEVLREQYLFLMSHVTTNVDVVGNPGRIGIIHYSTSPFLPEDVEPAEEAVIQSMDWFLMLEGQWDVTFQALGYVCKRLLILGRIRAVAEVFKRMPFEKVSLSKTSLNIMDDNLENGDATETRRKTRSGSAKPFTTRELRPVSPTDEDFSRQLMRQSSRVYRELEQLVKAVMALNEWAKVELEFREDQDRIIEKKPHVKKAIEECVAAMAPLYRDFLKNARDGTPAFFILFSHRAEYANAEATRLEREQSDLRTIRRLYLPELLLRHVVALNSAGHILTRDYMLKIMDLATIVATPESGLADDLVATNRMQELVTSFAESSQALLKLNEGSAQRKERRRTRGREGKTLAIWDVGVRNEGD
ncbi:hypothetical protein LTR04_004108, partial [Oleoguttula sp. CCFEE 6159]